VKYINNHPINEAHYCGKKWKDLFLGSVSGGIIENLKDCLVSLSDEIYISLYEDFDNDGAIIYINCEFNKFLSTESDFRIDEFEEFSSKLLELNKEIDAAIFRSQIDLKEKRISFNDNFEESEFEGEIVIFKLIISEKDYMK
jgi:hypothetical protein